jgi:hypothetical protein
MIGVSVFVVEDAVDCPVAVTMISFSETDPVAAGC